ncbi:DNA double-strand break repair protein Mre11 [Natrialbaceae archaeon AArc-T1-2]|uniref:DNA double-strand break repair protein Mre11 n=1 Tax=Natrialbaceae archaeon AArc-T1-2 TaxID=3053904 RepID=UPI00255B0287|nr:DNA double-strand break repair protein Mre11 [Natrialbaceae archaeon AArc-T1-2]WIV67625.1 DNA double-strand break repair protein Mre11 [Natrialbaceae archaeon AArc-T1-2]
MTRVIHTGDTHIGYQQYNAPERRRDFLEAFRSVATDAVADDVDAVVHAGDLFHDRRPGLVDLQGTIDVLRTLSEAGIPFLAIVGNHEGKRDAQWLDLFEDLGLATRLGATPHVIDDVAFYGLDFVPRSRRDDLAYEFEPVPETADHAVLVGHGLFEPFAHADWDTETVLEEATVDFDAVLLGDNHAPGTAEVADTWVTYCGSTERASASEREARGYNLLTLADDVRIARRAIEDAREFVFVDVTLAEDEGADRVRDRVREYDLADAVVIVTVEGEGEPITPAAIEEFALERGALIARVNDRREIEGDDEELSVHFADPDDAVRKRVRELGLSDAAREIDRTVRDGAVADANVRETVERRVQELLEDDPTTLEPAADGQAAVEETGASADGVDDDEGDGDGDGDASETTGEPTDGEQISMGEYS